MRRHGLACRISTAQPVHLGDFVMKTLFSTAGTGVAEVENVIDVSDVLAPGSKAGPWIVERELGRGGMGAVYAVVHEEIGKRAALKVVHQRLLSPSFNSDRMLLEAKVVNQVGHPNIVDIFETGKLPDGRPYIVMERLEGQPLSYRADDGKILPDQVIGILLQICDALIAAHAAGIVHRDLKLDNVFLVDNPDEPQLPRVKLLDWGIAKVLSHDVKHTIEGQLVGTPQYLAPEQARGAQVSPQTDVYSLGVMAYELFLEELPFTAETAPEIMAMHLRSAPPPPSDLWPDIPRDLEDLLLAMLSKSPEHRPTMLEVARKLEDVRGHMRPRAQTAPAPPATATPAVIVTPPRPRRAPSGFAATEYAEHHRTRRWQYALGGMAVAASLALLWVSRAGDNAASAATTQAGQIESSAPAALFAPAPDPVAIAPAPAAAPDPVEPDVVADDIARDPIEHKPVTIPLHTPLQRPVVHRPAVHHAAPHASPVAPRRWTKLDPDGTLDPYK